MDTPSSNRRRQTADESSARTASPKAREAASEASAAAPRSVEALRELAVRIGRREAAVVLGGKTHAVLAKLVERPEEVAVRTITELAAGLGVNASTLTRLTTRLGYQGFA